MKSHDNIQSFTDFDDLFKDTAIDFLGIKITELSDDHIVGTMTIDERHLQSLGLLHGGISCVLAETLGSSLSVVAASRQDKVSLGLEINANHLKGVRKGGVVEGRARFIQRGRSLHVMQIDITDEIGDMVCTSRLTTILKPASRYK